MSFETMDDVLAYAIGKEEEAVAFYTELSKKDNFASVKETFVSFAAEEEKHVKLLQNINDDKAKIDDYEIKNVPDLKISNYMVDTEYHDGMLMNDILKLAMKREEVAVKLYQDLADQSDHAALKKTFQILVQEEQKHKLALETMYDDFLAAHDN